MSGCHGGCIGRREFLARTALTAMAAALMNACGDGVIGGVGPSDGGLAGDLKINLADHPELATVGKVVRIDTGGVPIAVTRTGPDTFEALSLRCTHAGTTVDIVATGFTCPNHGARFDQHGTWTGGQTTSNLVSLTVKYDPAGPSLTISGGPANNVDLTLVLADYPALDRVGGIARVDGAAVPIGIARIGQATYVAYGLACTHEQRIVEPTGGRWECPKHGARFAADGSVLNGPATVPLVPLAVTHDAARATLRVTGWAPAGNLDDDDD